ncbi:recombinase family protein [Thalassotalea profundi]|uniref:Recombinase domain-containing protein n=1 Tax=Thalassotalea profundi TaxID=2036687 RepID=A0ABQ3INI7_9GAMM|nr:recombinase family protein [Thalassotalea profundi]GHE86287.1 hypothetical protein GCM10011501_14260 [Thalassotalea profundi]
MNSCVREYMLTPKIYSYTRFSSEKQLRGHSLQRQTEAIEEWLQNNNVNIPIDDTLHMRDLGVSAWSGANVGEDAALGGFLIAVKEGRVPRNSYLILEKLDRATRQKVTIAVGILTDIINHGITIVTLSDGKEYNEESLNKNSGMDFMFAIFQLGLAHQESQNKSERISKAYSNKIKQLVENDRPITHNKPNWLDVDDDGNFVVIKERADAIKYFFDVMVEKNLSLSQTCQFVNEEGKVQYWGKDGLWKSSFTRTLLNTRRVIGEWRSEAHDITRMMYPPIVDVKTYNKAVKLSNTNKTSKRAILYRSKHKTNLFTGIMTCGYCGNNINVRGKRNGEGRTRLYCSQDREKACKGHTAVYQTVEDAFLQFCTELDFTSIISPAETQLKLNSFQNELEQLESKKLSLETGLESLANFVMQGKASRTIQQKIDKEEQSLDLLNIQILEKQNQIRESNTEFIDGSIINYTYIELTKKLTELRSSDNEEDTNELYALRCRLSNHIASTVENITIMLHGFSAADNEDEIALVIKFTGCDTVRMINIKTKENHFFVTTKEDDTLYVEYDSQGNKYFKERYKYDDWSLHARQALSQARYERRAEALYNALSTRFEYEGAFIAANKLAEAMRSEEDDIENEAQSTAIIQARTQRIKDKLTKQYQKIEHEKLQRILKLYIKANEIQTNE